MTDEMPSTGVEGAAPRVELTETAVEKLKEVLGSYPRPVAGLRLQIVGRGPEGFEHVLSLVEQGHAQEGDVFVEANGLPVYLEGRNAPYLNGLRINYRDKGPDVSGLEFENPNPVWFDELGQRVQELFD